MSGANDALQVPISALQHYVYCPRQCALIHVEQTFDDNVFTQRGQQLHERAHEATAEVIDGVRIERALPLWSERLGLVGVADVVEFDGAVVRPVDYKHGRRRPGRHDDVQVCAQGMCLEEMLGVTIVAGAVYHHGSRGRRAVPFTHELRGLTERTVVDVRQLLEDQVVPPPAHGPRCRECSLAEACWPDRSLLGGDDPFAAPCGTDA